MAEASALAVCCVRYHTAIDATRVLFVCIYNIHMLHSVFCGMALRCGFNCRQSVIVSIAVRRLGVHSSAKIIVDLNAPRTRVLACGNASTLARRWPSSRGGNSPAPSIYTINNAKSACVCVVQTVYGNGILPAPFTNLKVSICIAWRNN